MTESKKGYNFVFRHFLNNYSLILVYLSYFTYYIKNSPHSFSILWSTASFVIIFVIILSQLLFNFLLRYFHNSSIKFIYILTLFLLFLFLNLTYLLLFISTQIYNHANGILRGRHILILFIVIFSFISYIGIKKFPLIIKVINTFLITFILTNILFSIQNISNADLNKNDNFGNKYPSKVNAQGTLKAKNILFILLDEYASPDELIKFSNDTASISVFNKYLRSKGFSLITNNRSKEQTTMNSLNRLFNDNSGLTFQNHSIENLTSELKNSYVINSLKNKGYQFRNFSFFNIGNNKESYNLYLFPRNDYEIVVKYSLYLLIMPNLGYENLKRFENFVYTSDYNKQVESQSLKYLNNLKDGKPNFIYVHFFFPHSPFYIENEYKKKRINLDNYTDYWKFSNQKIIKYLNSIKNVSSYKIIISGDHGFRSDARIDPFKTFSAFHNFEEKDIHKISTVQDIGALLLAQ